MVYSPNSNLFVSWKKERKSQIEDRIRVIFERSSDLGLNRFLDSTFESESLEKIFLRIGVPIFKSFFGKRTRFRMRDFTK
ncbi:hypothetical protein DLM75_04820 [Leptospira stimsonii]|uniref:Uncharacterized protein n=1 Tax=Leptospira stimsonii TaxID=2202203 RepID=A0A396ZB36_9LEPT|nr:hypothetical protein DLM75_04820 [Leptospira stimsonii]